MAFFRGVRMDERTKWEVDKLKKEVNENSDDIKSLNDFKTKTVEQLKTLFNTVDEIKKSNRWMSQSFIYLLAGGIISGITSLLVWLIQR